MFGEQCQKSQHTTYDACGAEQHQIDSPQSRSFAETVNGCRCGKYEKKERALQWGGHPAAFFFIGDSVYDQCFVGYERTLNGVIGNLGTCESIHQIKGGKHHLTLRDRPVCFASDAEVDAEAGPRVPFAILMHDVTEGA